MAYQYMPKIFYGPQKDPQPPPPYILQPPPPSQECYQEIHMNE